MSNRPFPKEPLRAALRASLPTIEPEATPGMSSSAISQTYVPGSHAKALDPESVLVEGIRGAGKSFWWNALINPEHRRFVAAAFPETGLKQTTVAFPGYGLLAQPLEHFPPKDVIREIVKQSEPRHIGKGVIAHHLRFQGGFEAFAKWPDRVQWVAHNAEEFEVLLAHADAALSEKGQRCIILFDALDRLSDDWASLRPICKALFQVALDIKSTASIRCKLFVRPDMIEDSAIVSFSDSSKLLGQKVSLRWQRADLYALLFQCLGNDMENGSSFRDHALTEFGLTWDKIPGQSLMRLPTNLRSDDDLQKRLFHAITGPTMATGTSGHKRGFPYTWLPNHLRDGRDQVSPRSFAAALRTAADTPVSAANWEYPIHFRGLQAGVQAASQIRVNEITKEDYPWVDAAMKPIKGATIPCDKKEFFGRWDTDRTLKTLTSEAQKLPPQHLDEGVTGLLRDLKDLGIVAFLTDGRIQMPDVYRIAFGLGRKGGVKPVR